MKRCYVVECNSGQYDDYRWWIAGIFEEPFAAEKLKQDILKEIEILRNIEPPCDTNDWENLSKEQINAWDKWSEYPEDLEAILKYIIA